LLGPVSDATADAMLARLPERGLTRVLDVGCGKGELLVRALERCGGTGVGVEPNPSFAAEARARADRLLGPGRARIDEAEFDAARLAGERFPLVICTGSLHAFGDWAAALRGVAALVAPSGYALLGPSYWKREPAPKYLEVIGARADELTPLRETLATAAAGGWSVVAVHESTPAEWDGYELRYAANVRAWCAAHAADPDSRGFLERITRWSAAYGRWGRDCLGYALVLLMPPGAHSAGKRQH